MEDLFKKFINAGVGFVSLTSDRFQNTIDKLVKESKLSEQEGKKIMDDLKKNTDTKRKELESQFTGIANRLMKSAGVATNADVEELKRSVRGTKSATASSGSKSGAKPASSATAKAAGATKKAADKVSSAAGTTQKSAAAKAGATKAAAKPAAKSSAKKETPKADSASSSDNNAS